MATGRKRPPRRARKKEPENGVHFAKVLLEHMNGQFQVVLERLQDMATKRELADVCERLDAQGGRIDRLEAALLQTRRDVTARFDGIDKRFDGIDKRFDGVDKRFDGIDQELHSLRDNVSRQAQGAELRVLEQRVAVVERHLGI